jgi:hypothetical protein
MLVGLLCLLGLVSLPSAVLAGTGAGVTPVIHAGTLSFDLDPTALSFLDIDSAALGGDSLCRGLVAVDVWGGVAPRGECDLSVGTPPPIDLYVDDGVPNSGTLRVAAQPTGSTVLPGSVPISTPCGLWDVSLVLGPGVSQPVSQLVLTPDGTDPAQGVFAGVLKLSGHYHFANRDKKTILDVPTVASLDLSGHWAAIPEGGPSLGPGTSNLVLFSRVLHGEWSSVPTCDGTWGSGSCHVCATAPDVLPSLNLTP